MISKWEAWMRVLRVKFFIAGIPSVILGSAISWYFNRTFDSYIFFLTLAGVIAAMAGCYLFNEYFDYKSGVDILVERENVTPYSGGSRVLPEGYLSPSLVFMAGIISWSLACVIGIYLAMIRGFLVLMFALLGFFTGALYSLPPFKWAYRGVGEVLIGVTYGPLITLGSCYVQLMRVKFEAVVPSLIPGMLITAVILINEFPDFFADKEAGKRNLVVRMGKKSAAKLYVFLIISPYSIIISSAVSNLFPSTTLITLLTFPLALRHAQSITRKYDGKARDIVPIIRGTILLFTLTTLLLSLGYILGA
jgi:1,4-dihydroxy-2-naphthoate octaprenyltransferase